MTRITKKLFLLALLLGLVGPEPTFAQTGGESPSGKHVSVSHSSLENCLPPGIKYSDVVEVVGSRKITVEQKLKDLRAARDSDNKLVDGNGKRIVFYHLIGCWGIPPPNYRELLQKQRNEIAQLKQQNTVIEMTCNPSGVRIP